ncbi:glycoside hydrolase family 30 protein [Echinimonas agarilytica]|uniref:Glycosyl hydrolase n=1 Tax=Echinimonas agarilytica TaxID=1215918 RepID=A0AA42B664_9GAMM|nr:glycoside hydrolase family 30 beta sandwich domain-containing protein [Echinimonas agarilytica]MCM2678370.1 glycosyl hydrolase [Echinimonas agarilytica]
MNPNALKAPAALMLAATLGACGQPKLSSLMNQTASAQAPSMNYQIGETSAIWVTSEAGDKVQRTNNISFDAAAPQSGDHVLSIHPDQVKQTITGIGSSFTESSAFVLAHLTPKQREQVMMDIYGESGANFSLTRTPIGATDFSVQGRYSYADVADDADLEHFSIGPDRDGFSRSKYSGIQDESFDVLPMIQQALAIKQSQADKDLRIVASAWTAPAWMKDIETWYIKPTAENNHQGTGGILKPEYEATYANYIVKYLDAYHQAGVDIWGLTPVNEPHGNSGQWESMHFTPETQRDFIKEHLGPTLKASAHGDINLLIYDQNRDGFEAWADTILGDAESADYVYGSAVHWYSSTFKVHEDILERVHQKFPKFDIIHTEGTIDDLGKPAPEGVLDPDGFTETGWFANDDFWWNQNATDWAYTATWAPSPEDHPMYTPVHRYARNIIVSLNHWMSGWIDWNVVLDANGGPNHVGNFCGAPIMIDTDSGEIYYTPVYHILKQFSQTIRPGDKAVQANKTLVNLDDDALHTSATLSTSGLLSVQVLNTTKQAIATKLKVGLQQANLTVPANSLQTVQLQLPQ